jgi:hypothetical protein
MECSSSGRQWQSMRSPWLLFLFVDQNNTSNPLELEQIGNQPRDACDCMCVFVVATAPRGMAASQYCFLRRFYDGSQTPLPEAHLLIVVVIDLDQ